MQAVFIITFPQRWPVDISMIPIENPPSGGFCGGTIWVRTRDLFDVSEAKSLAVAGGIKWARTIDLHDVNVAL